jgi:hypothetical protein
MKHVRLRATFAAAIAGTCAAGVAGPASGHHSLVMFDREHLIELIGTVREFKFISPHALTAGGDGQGGAARHLES